MINIHTLFHLDVWLAREKFYLISIQRRQVTGPSIAVSVVVALASRKPYYEKPGEIEQAHITRRPAPRFGLKHLLSWLGISFLG